MDNTSRTQPSFRSMDVLPPRSLGGTPAGGAPPLPKPPVSVAPTPMPTPPTPNLAPNRSGGITAQAGNVPLAEQKSQPSPVTSNLPSSGAVMSEAPINSSTGAGDPDKELDHIIHEVDKDKKHPANNKTNRQRPIMVAVIALVVAVVLAIVAVYTFRNTQKVDPAPSVTNLNTAQQSQPKAVTSAELDATSQSIDKEMGNLNDTQDFNTTDVSDQALGL